MNYSLVWFFIILAAALDVWGVIVIKMRLNFIGEIKFESFYSIIKYCYSIINTPITFLAALAITISPIFYAFALSKINLSIAYPLILAFSSFFLLLFSVIILNEILTIKNVIGISIIMLGVFIIYLK
jgi:multidrug transporter EmrE-like cation transporter